MVYDLASNTQVGIPAQFGQVLVPYAFWLRAISTGRSRVSADLGAVMLPWASQIDTGKAAGSVTPLLVTSRAGGVQQTTAFISPDGPLSRDSLRPRVVAALATRPPASASAGPRGRVVAIGCSDFASDRYARNSATNILLVLNAIDWLAPDDALIPIRSKDRPPPPPAFASGVNRGGAQYGNLIGVPAPAVPGRPVRRWRPRPATPRGEWPARSGGEA